MMRWARVITGMLGVPALAAVGAYAIGNPAIENMFVMLVLVGVLALNVAFNFMAGLEDE